MEQDTRWIQRLENYGRAIINLESAVNIKKNRDLSPLEVQGLIKAFEQVHELAWNTLKDFYEYQGEVKIMGSRDAFRLAFKRELIQNGEVFMQSIKTRQQSVHSYSEETAHKIQYEILHVYFEEFKKLYETLSAIQKKTDF